MTKEWYIMIDGEEEGPYSINDLKYDSRITKETLVRKEGSDKWQAIKKVKELKFLFEEEVVEEEEPDQIDKIPEGYVQEEIALRYEPEPPISVFWIILALSIALYIVFRTLLP